MIERNKQTDLVENTLKNLCKFSTKKRGPNNPYCRLYNKESEFTKSQVLELNENVNALKNFFKTKNIGVFPKIIETSMIDKNTTLNFLKLIVNFIKNKNFDNDEIKKKLIKLQRTKKIPTDLEDLLKIVRNKEYDEYEKSFVGTEFDKFRTKLTLDYKCGETVEEKFIDFIKNIKENKISLVEFTNYVTNCIEKSIQNQTNPIKSDIISLVALYIIEDGEKKEICPIGSKFEVKKMDDEIDSYLSEFFAIFKQSDILHLKVEYLPLYNQIIDNLFKWLQINGNDYLENIKKQIGGIFFDNYVFVPIENIDLYWSNQGQRGFEERRLTIRFRVKDGDVDTYLYEKGSNILVKNPKRFDRKHKEHILCC